MKIGCFVSQYPYKKYPDEKEYFKRYWRGGAENVAYNLAIGMALRGHKISVFTTSMDSDAGIERYENLDIYRHSTTFRAMNRTVSVSLLLNATNYQVDVVHAHLTNSPNDFVIPRYKKKNIPLVVTYHGDPQKKMGGFIYKLGVSFYTKYAIEKTFSCANLIISPSEHYINESRFLGKYRDKIVVIPNGITIADFDIAYSKDACREKLGLPHGGNILLFLGTLGSHKGPDVLLRAMPKIIKEIPDVKLVFAGGGPLREVLERQSKKLDIEKQVIFAGFVEEDLKPFYYMAADVFVLPSIMKHEIFGIVNLEAMACSVPIVASKIAGVPDVVKDGENGLLVPPGDSDALADAVIYLLENDIVRDEMGRNARKKVEAYSWEKIAETTEKVYERVTEIE